MIVAGATASNKLDWFLDFHEMIVAGATSSNKLDIGFMISIK